MLRHILTRPDGMYYVYVRPLHRLPPVFASRETSLWLAALELLAQYACAPEELAFARAYLYLNQQPDGQWDLGAKSNDKVYFPLSDSWRTEALRKADCTERIQRLLVRIGG